MERKDDNNTILIDHVDDVGGHATASEELEESESFHWRTYLVIMAVDMAYVAQLVALIGSGALATNIAAVTGGQTVWFSSLITIFTSLLGPPISQAADYWGRKLLLILMTTAGFVGCIVISRATSYAGVLAGFSITGVAFGAQPLSITISSEVIPRRQRSYGQAIFGVMGCSSGVAALLVGGALTQNGHNEGFRVYYYIAAGLFGLAVILIAISYDPVRRETEKELSFYDKLSKLDWPAYFLLAAGVVLFSIGLSWSQNPYEWSDPHVSVTFSLGMLSFICLCLYACFWNKTGVLHHQLFRNRNFSIACGCLFVEGLSFFAANSYLPYEAEVFFPSNAILTGLHFGIAFIAAMVGSFACAVFSWKTKTIRPPTVFAYLCFVIFFVLMAIIKVTASNNFWAYPIFLGIGFGICLTTLTTAAQFATPLELISTTTGVLLTARNLGATIGLAIYNAIFNNQLSKLPTKIAAATLPLGLPKTSVASLVGALEAQETESLSKIPGISENIIEAAEFALKNTYLEAFRYIWVTAGVFVFVAFIASFFLQENQANFSTHVDAPVKGGTPQHIEKGPETA
ncbi:major facilitator superfamily domain-containing protein [Penicillium malachiteum]|uniref:Major facilitator superfamily domain-containing protein n=1 Tax=Penicillium malachiteum TaxID=1324776 RepID=A0AAD6HUM1_9EURO|nr:major facilitator superfamily domain-containing protein [Penicillium malachiteum]